MAFKLDSKGSEAFLETASEMIQSVLLSKGSKSPLYLGPKFQTTSSKPSQDQIFELFSNCVQLVSTSDTLPLTSRLRNLRIVQDVKKIIVTDYPNLQFLINSGLIVPCLKANTLSFKAFWAKTCKELLALDRMLMLAISHKVQFAIRLREFLNEKPETISVEILDSEVQYHLIDPEVKSARMAAFLFQIFRNKAFETPQVTKSFKFSKTEFSSRFQRMSVFCFEEDKSISDYAKLLYWMYSFDDMNSRSSKLNAIFLEVYEKYSSYKKLLVGSDTIEAFNDLIPQSLALNLLLKQIAVYQGDSEHKFDINNIPPEFYESILALFSEYEKGASLRANAFDFFIRTELSLKEENKRDLRFKREYQALNRAHPSPELGINLTSYLEIRNQVSADTLYPLCDSEEFLGLKPAKSPLSHFDKYLKEEALSPPSSPSLLRSAIPLSQIQESQPVVPIPSILEITDHNRASILRSSKKVFEDSYSNKQLHRSLAKFEHHERVSIWHENPGLALARNYSALSQELQKHVQFIHSFPLEVDLLLGTEYSAFMEWKNPARKTDSSEDWLLALPCEVQRGVKVERGFFVYTIDPKTSKCYHRCFDIETEKLPFGTAISQGWSKIAENFSWKDADFPSLETALKVHTTKKQPTAATCINKIFIDTITNILTIQTKEGVTYRFFKII